MASGIFRPRRRPAQPRQRLIGGVPPVRAVTGAVLAGIVGLARPAKRTAPTADSSVVSRPSGTAVKVVSLDGVCSLVSTSTSSNAKRAAPVSNDVVGIIGVSAELKKLTAPTGFVGVAVVLRAVSTPPAPAVVGVIGTAGQPTKTVSPIGVCAAGVGSVGAAGKRAPVRGRVRAGFDGVTAVIKAVSPAGEAVVGVDGQVTFPALVAGGGVAAPVCTGQPVKVAVVGGVCQIGSTTRGRAARKAFAAGQARLATTPLGTSRSKVASVAGRTVIGAFALGSGVVVGPTTGIRTSKPLLLPELPIVGSQVLWDATVPTGASVTVETSVDNGATWQQATHGGPVPRLLPGTQVAKAVLSRVTLTRTNADDPSPRLHWLEVRVSVDGSVEELVPLGRFTLNEVSIHDSPSNGVEVEIAGADLARKVSRNRWDRTYVIYENTNYADAIRAVVTNRLPGVQTNFVTTNMVTPRLFFGEQENNDPWQDAIDMAEVIGCELFFDPLGVCTLRPEPDPELLRSVWEFEDESNPTMTDLIRRVTDENTYNMVIVTGEGSYNTAPVRAVARDLDPSSPTYVLGPYGLVTYRVTSSMVLSQSQAQAAAEGLLRRVKGATEAVELEAVPMPALEPGDVVTVTRGRSKVEGRFLIDQLRIPLGADEPMRAVGRRQRL